MDRELSYFSLLELDDGAHLHLDEESGGGTPPVFDGSEPDAGELSAFERLHVVGKDDRKKVSASASETYPLSALAHLEIVFEGSEPIENRQATGTGWLAGSSTVVTAGHCLKNYHFTPPRRAIQIAVYPARNEPRRPFGPLLAGWNDCVIAKGWNSASDGTEPAAEFDYGAIHLSSGIGSMTGWLNLGLFKPEDFSQMKIAIVGYPGKTGTHPKPHGTMWGQFGRFEAIASSSDPMLTYTIDTTPGQSGAPVLTTFQKKPYVVAIHKGTYGAHNRAVRVSQSVFQEISGWIR